MRICVWRYAPKFFQTKTKLVGEKNMAREYQQKQTTHKPVCHGCATAALIMRSVYIPDATSGEQTNQEVGTNVASSQVRKSNPEKSQARH